MGCSTKYFGVAKMTATEPRFSVGDRVRTVEQVTSDSYDEGRVTRTEPGRVRVEWERAKMSYWEDPFELVLVAAQSIPPARDIIREFPDPPGPQPRTATPTRILIGCTEDERARWHRIAKLRGTNLSKMVREFLNSFPDV